MLRIIAGLFAVSLVLAAPSRADCLSHDTVVGYLRAALPAIAIEPLAGGDARQFIAAYNAAPPASTIDADSLLLASRGSEGVVRVIFFRSGCAVASGRIPTPLARRFLEQARRGNV